MNGNDVEKYLISLPHAKLNARDNNDYLISFQLDTGVELAFEPRTKTKVSIFVANLPVRLIATGDISLEATYPPESPSTALERVSSQLSELTTKHRLQVYTHQGLERLIEWVRWA